MADTTFTNGVTVTDADWFNDLNRLHYTIFSDPADLTAVKTSVLASPVAIGSGTPAAGTFTNLVATGNASVTGTLGVTGAATLPSITGVTTFANQPVLSSLTASRAVFTDGSKGLVSNAITGTGNVVMSASPTLTGTITAASATLSGNLTLSGLTSGRVPLVSTGGLVTSSGTYAYNDTGGATGRSLTVSGSGSGGVTIKAQATTAAAIGTLEAASTSGSAIVSSSSGAGAVLTLSDGASTWCATTIDGGDYLSFNQFGVSGAADKIAIHPDGHIQAVADQAIVGAGFNAPVLTAGNADDIGIYACVGAPTFSAGKGSLALRTDGSTTNDRMYVNTNGSTGWTAVITAT